MAVMKHLYGHRLSRREALRAAGTGAVALAATGWSGLSGAQPSGRIDIHHHWHPQPISDAFGGVSIGASWPGGEWTVDRALELMDRFGIATGILSVRNPRTRVSPSLCREVNELAARLIADHPDRFGALAFLPQFDFERAVEEAVFALDVLELDGVLLNPSVDNVYLGVPQLDPPDVGAGRA